MLHRAARRRNALRYFQQSSEQLLLPWLCPALVRHQSRATAHLPVTRSASTVEKPAAIVLNPTSRGLATAAAEAHFYEDDYIPFEFPPPSFAPVQASPGANQWHSRQTNLADLKPFDTSNLLMINEGDEEIPTRLRRTRLLGIGGTGSEALETFEACLQVHRFERAQALLRRLALFFPANSQELRDAYNRYIREVITAIIIYRKQQHLVPLQKFFEVGMRQAGVEPDATTYALMIKVAIYALYGPKRDRTVRRYWHLAKEAGLENMVQDLPSILLDSDLGELSKICPTDFQYPQWSMEEYSPTSPPDEAAKRRSQIDILAVDQKGLGLSSLKQSLSLFSGNSHLPYPTDESLSPQARDEQYAILRQTRLEQDAVQSAIERWRKEAASLKSVGVDATLQRKAIGLHLWDWHQLLTSKIREELKLVEEAESKHDPAREDSDRCEYGPFLRLVTPEKLAAVCILSSMGILSKNGVERGIRVTRIVHHLGKMVNDEAQTEAARKAVVEGLPVNGKKRRSTVLQELRLKESTRPRNRGGVQQKWVYSPRSFAGETHLRWSTTIHVKVGAILSSLLFDVAKITVSKEDPETKELLQSIQPVFQHSYKYDKGRRIGFIHLNSAAVELLLREPAGAMLAKHLPMVSPPRPWKGIEDGGFLGYPVSAIRVKNNDRFQMKYAEAAGERGDLDQMFKGLDILGRTPWKVNRGVFEVMVKAWNSGKPVANLPELNPDLPLPSQPANFQQDPIARGKWHRAVLAIENKRSGLHSNRCFQNFQMEIAKAYLDETFYLPHNVDFRGRAYPIPPYLNQMGADNCRGLLLFGKGRPLGSHGLRWLKIHLANVFGYDKASLTEREQFATDHLADIHDSATNALNGKRWWLQAEDPWQCLAACMEIKNALDSPDPAQFVSHLPVHQDGSCNGLQHYAALGGDLAGAQQVNLEPGDRPSDVYTGVAELVRAEVKADAARGLEIAKFLDGRITRKVVKQTVMTNVYGVTFLGAIRQVRKQLEDLIPDLGQEGGLGFAVGATYIARKIFQALSAIFTGAHDIQYWLGDCATRISTSISPDQAAIVQRQLKQKDGTTLSTRRRKKDEGSLVDPAAFRSSVIWTTPLKLPVVQPYRTSKARRIITNLQHISIKEPHAQNSVNKRKQLQAFPPNFIHSLDATHMILSAIKCDELGLSFAAVHDSFWTHAADIDVMNRVLRDAFIRMHSEDVVGRLAEEFQTRYNGYLYLAQVAHDSLLAAKIKKMRREKRSGSGTGIKVLRNKELVEEWERQKLLNSDDPKQRKKGAAMVTPASLFEATKDKEKVLVEKHSLGETAIGYVPAQTSEHILEKALNESDVDVDMEHTLNPLIEGENDSFEEAFESDVHETTAPQAADAKDAGSDQPSEEKPKKTNPRNNVWLWLPLQFPPLPKKGEFDVTRLKESQYFFS